MTTDLAQLFAEHPLPWHCLSDYTDVLGDANHRWVASARSNHPGIIQLLLTAAAEHDPTPVDEAWLREQGFEVTRISNDGYWIANLRMRVHADGMTTFNGSILPGSPTTRGDVLTLKRALRIG